MNLQPRSPADLSKRAVEVLRTMARYEHEDDGELVCERLECWIGDTRTSYRVLAQLLECCFISASWSESGSYRVFVINDSGRRFLQGKPPYRDAEGKYHETLFSILSKPTGTRP